MLSESNNEKCVFLQLIRKAIGAGATVAEPADWAALWKLAQRHHLEAMIADAAEAAQNIPTDIGEQMKKTSANMIARSIRQGYWLQRLEEQLKKDNIPFALLKGALLCKDYPKEYYRYMSDIDIYIRPEDRKRIRSAVEAIGGTYKNADAGDEAFLLGDAVRVEFHGRLAYRNKDGVVQSYPEWSFVDEERNRLSEEGYALNLIGHAIGDLADAGLGIRYVLDLWIYKNRHNLQPNWEAVEARLREDGMDRAARNLFLLGEFLFGSGEATPLLEEMAQYVLSSGLYGDGGRAAASEMSRSGNRGKAIAKQVFRSRTEFENRYPWLKRYAVLMPIAWIIRLVDSLRKNKGYIGRWLYRLKSVSKKDIQEQRSRLIRFGL